MSHLYLPGARNHFRIEREALRELLRFGRWIFVSTVLAFLAGQSDRIILGKLAPLAMLGVYSIASMLAGLPTQAVLKVGSAVVFPAYSRMAARDDFPAIFLRVRWPLILGGAAVCSVLLAAGPSLVHVLYDPRYRDAGWILQYLSVGAWFQVLECTRGAALLARGQTRWVAAGSAAKVAGLLLAIPFGFHLGGFRGALAGMVLAEAARYLAAASGAASIGLRGAGRDALATVGVVASGLLGAAVGASVERVGGPVASALAASLVAAAPWVLPGLAAWRSERAVRFSVTTT